MKCLPGLRIKRVRLCIAIIGFLPGTPAYAAFRGRVVDRADRRPIPGAIVTSGNLTATTGQDGRFQIGETAGFVGARASGYRQTQVGAAIFKGAAPDIGLTPFRPKALYLSVYGIGARTLRDPALALAARAGINALVIDVKGDRGLIPYRSSVALAARLGANRVVTVGDIHGLIQDLHGRGLYLIARIVVFKDNPLAESRPDLAVKSSGGRIWRDREGLAWVDPSKKQAWDYSIDIAVEAAGNGFDEIQFDYVRFPDAKGVSYSVANTEQNRVDALSGFLREARARLAPLNVFLAADVFGYIPWNLNDTDIGQRIDKLAPLVDYLCPMLYPSGFQFGIPGYRMPVAHPYEIVRLSLDRAAQRSQLPPARFRPWLQAFRDYAFDKRVFGPKEIAEQIRAAEEFGSDGWMLWNPHNVYSDDGLPHIK
jgi:hypothetical protein